VVYVRFIGTHAQYDQDRCANYLKEQVHGIKRSKPKPIYRAALKEIETLMPARAGTPEGERLDVLVTLVEATRKKHYLFDLPDPVEAIKFRMEQMALAPRTWFR